MNLGAWLLKIVKCNKYRFLKSSHSQVRVYTDLHHGFNLFHRMILLKMHFTSNSTPRFFYKFSKPPIRPGSPPLLYAHAFQRAWEWNLQACEYLTYIYHMLIFSRKGAWERTPSTIAAGKLRKKCPYFEPAKHLGFSNTEVAQAGPAGRRTQAPEGCPWELGGAVLGWFPAGCTTVTRIRKSCITFCRENRNGRI